MKILFLKDKAVWDNYLKRLKEVNDVYFSAEYYQIAEKQGEGRASCFVFEEGDKLALYPFLLNSVNKYGYALDNEYYDIQGIYGYNGVLTNSYDANFRLSFYNSFHSYCLENNIIAEFTRFHPLLKNQRFSMEYMNVEYDRDTFYFDLNESLESIYSKISRQAKQGIKRGIKNKLIFEEAGANDYLIFYKMYLETMNRVSAEKYFYFSKSYFNKISKFNKSIQFNIKYNNKVIAAALCLYTDTFFHFHLAASNFKYQSLRPNNYLMWKLIEYTKNEGFKYFFIGGGRSSEITDSLLRFKSSFSKKTAGFFVGKKIHYPEIYNQVIEQWLKKNENREKEQYQKLLRYHN